MYAIRSYYAPAGRLRVEDVTDMRRSLLISKAALQGKDALRTLLDENDDGDEDHDLGDHGAGPAFEQLAEDAQAKGGPDRAGELAAIANGQAKLGYRVPLIGGWPLSMSNFIDNAGANA